jgi:spoIIIJ-associated protein
MRQLSLTQSNQIEKTAKNIDDAILAALEELGVGRDKVDVEVIDEGTKGLLGIFGGKDAKVRVSLKNNPINLATDFLKEIFDEMGLSVDFETNLDGNDLTINLVGDDMGIIIGKRGETLDALQYLTSLVVNHRGGSYIKVTLDTENYRIKRQEALRALAIRIAEKVSRTGRRHIFEPMNPYERRVLHATLQSHEVVTTYSIGEDPNRKVVVALKNDSRKKQ